MYSEIDTFITLGVGCFYNGLKMKIVGLEKAAWGCSFDEVLQPLDDLEEGLASHDLVTLDGDLPCNLITDQGLVVLKELEGGGVQEVFKFLGGHSFHGQTGDRKLKQVKNH